MPAPIQPVLFLPHGGGPCFFMKWPAPWEHCWDSMATFLKGVGADLPNRPAAIVVVSGHWETPVVRVTTGTAPSLIFDYTGFPSHTYNLTYPAPGAPELAEQIITLLRESGIAAEGDPTRGFDHGVFIPFLLAFSDADIPVIEISLPDHATAEDALALGQALEPMRHRDVLIIGTGMTYHNLRHFMSNDATSNARSLAFDTWLHNTIEAPSEARNTRLKQWQTAPYAHDVHPEPEHLLPLMFAAGAAGTDHGKRTFNDRVMGKMLSAYRFA